MLLLLLWLLLFNVCHVVKIMLIVVVMRHAGRRRSAGCRLLRGAKGSSCCYESHNKRSESVRKEEDRKRVTECMLA